MFQELFPILAANNMAQSLNFYRDLLGAELTYQFPPEGDPTYVTVKIGSSSLGIGENVGDLDQTNNGLELCIYTNDCDVAVEHLREAGVPILAEPEDQDWGERMARVADPDGNRIMILARL